ncbi:MATE family efflux transporter [Marinobacterium arenosum]|uniref:MATE family efflux transporter n=1 Tax=Marinobacterium arenosum TaxID=2862496 RepID=UPI001C9627A5|nr:MATE family efflux transporter [Marinobacterium arenosum]MBY4676505.1 MATE family efflux transporter [Marinobacterium arenosum]
MSFWRRYRPDANQHREVWGLAWPMILSNISVPLLGMVDTAVIGHLPESHHLGAVAVGAMIFSILYWAFGFLRMGTTGLTAQAVGRQDGDNNRLVLAQSLVLATLIGGLILLLNQPAVQLALQLMDAAPEVTVEADKYAAIRVLGAPAVLCNYALLGWFVGNQNTRIPLLLLLVTNISNMLLDVLAVYGLGMKADGVALATVCSEYLALVLGLWLARRQLQRVSGALNRERLRRWRDYYDLLVLNRYLFIRTLAILFAIAFFTAQGARQSTEILSANAVLLNFLLLISNGLDGFAHATEALTGRDIGRRDLGRFYRMINAAALWSLITAVLMSLLFWLAGDGIIRLLTDIEPVRQLAMQYLPWIWVLPLIGVWSYLLDGIFVGTTQVKAMQDTMLLSVFGVYLPLWWLCQPLGNHGLWLAFIALFVARGLSGGYVYWQLCRQQRWF